MTPSLASTEIVLDLSRLISRMLHTMPTGVDRVEMAYARALLAQHPGPLSFAAVHPLGSYGRLDRTAVLRFLDETEKRWTSSNHVGWFSLRLWAWRRLISLRPRRIPARAIDQRRVFVQASPHHLHKMEWIASKLRREQAPLACLIHDLIPVEFPEYARPGGAELHRKRMLTVGRLAAGVVANSQATAESFRRFLSGMLPLPTIRVAHLGTGSAPTGSVGQGAPPIPRRPYFVMVGTIEPRKNHIMLLNIWRRMVEQRGHSATPTLVIIGRRGWENENVIDMLERCEALQHHVIEYSGLSDMAMDELMTSARALLLPSFAEGFGMPVTEAIAAGVPVICSDLPALREAACNRAEYLDPLDGPAWIEAISDYAHPHSARRDAAMRRIAGWQPPCWDSHIDVVLELVKEISR